MNLRGFTHVRNKLLSGFLSLLLLSTVGLGTPLPSEDKNVTDTPDFAVAPPCALPCTRGVIRISHTGNGPVIGYISNSYPVPFPDQGTEFYLVTTSISDALVVHLPSTNIVSNLRVNSFNIYAANPPNSNYHYLGASVDIGTLNIEGTNIALFTGTQEVPVGIPQTSAIHQISDNTFRGESQIWFLSCLRQFSSKFVNEDGTTSQGKYFYSPTLGQPDLLGMATNIPASASQVTFTFIPQCTCPARCRRIFSCIC